MEAEDGDDANSVRQSALSRHNGVNTYMPAMPNTSMISLLCLLGSLSFRTDGIGRMTMTKFVKMFMPALKNQRKYSFKQFPPGMVRSQKYWMGQQARIPEIVVQSPYADTRTRTV